MLFRESYEFTCLIIAIFGKDCQVFFPYLAIIFLFFRQQKTPGRMPGERNDSFLCRFQLFWRGTISPALRDMHLLTRKTPSVSTPRHRGK